MQQGLAYWTGTLQSAATATGNGTALAIRDEANGAAATFTAQVVGITVATITWEATMDGATWVAVRFMSLTTGTEATTAAADGIYTASLRGVASVRARISSYVSGTITVTGAGA